MIMEKHFDIKKCTNQMETELPDSLIASGKYIQLHKDNVYTNGKHCIEKSDLMDDEINPQRRIKMIKHLT